MDTGFVVSMPSPGYTKEKYHTDKEAGSMEKTMRYFIRLLSPEETPPAASESFPARGMGTAHRSFEIFKAIFWIALSIAVSLLLSMLH